MHRDKKIGFALGILLVGIVAAFFFRNEPDPFAELPPLDDPAGLDAQIAENPIAPYPQEAGPGTSEAPVAAPPKNPWDMSEVFRPSPGPPLESAGLPIAAGAPAPISLAEPVPDPTSDANRLIEVGSPFGLVDVAKPNPVPEPPLPGNEGWTAIPEQPVPTAQKPPSTVAKTPPAGAETPASQTSMYKIVPGDTLSVLAEKHLGSSRRYMEIYEANRDKLRNPDDIKIGMLIRIPPRVKFDGGNSTQEVEAPQTPPPFRPEATTILPQREESNRFMPFSRSPLGPVPY